MTKIVYWQGIGLCGLALFSFAAMARQQPATPAQKWGSHVDVEAKPGSKRSLGEVDLFTKLCSSCHSVIPA